LLDRIAIASELDDIDTIPDPDLPEYGPPYTQEVSDATVPDISEAQPETIEGGEDRQVAEGERGGEEERPPVSRPSEAEPRDIEELALHGSREGNNLGPDRDHIGTGRDQGQGRIHEPEQGRSLDKTEAGAQTVLPGAERISEGEQAQRQADKPLKPKVPQKEAGGLFSDDSKQTDLIDRLRKPDVLTSAPQPIFYSGLIKAEGLKQSKAPATQWLATIRKAD
jgi:hypothetical protein